MEFNIRSIVTIMFTNDGKIVLTKNELGNYDVIRHQYGIRQGVHEGKSFFNVDSNSLVNDDLEYRSKIAELIGTALNQIRDFSNMIYGNYHSIVDCGTYARDFQLKEMANSDYTTFIRIKDEKIPLTNKNHDRILDNISLRYVVLGRNVPLDELSGMTFISLDELEDFVNDNRNKSLYLQWFLNDENLEKVVNFSTMLSNYNERKSYS